MSFDLASIGYLGIALIIFIETGVLFGIFLPGDSLLIAAGMMTAQGYFNIWLMAGACSLAAFIGNLCGYWIGQKYGYPLIEKYTAKWGALDAAKVQKTKDFLTRHHNAGIVLARFVPAARTLAPIMAGILNIKLMPFIVYSLLGAVIWGAGLPILGYYVGYLLPPSFMHYLIIPVLFFIGLMVVWPFIQAKLKKRGNP